MTDESKDAYEAIGERAKRAGMPRHANPFATATQCEDMREFAPWTPAFGGNDENLPAYYWEIGWENAEQEKTK